MSKSQKIVSVNSVSFLLKCKKRSTLVGPTFFDTFYCQKHGKISSESKQEYSFWEIDKKRFYHIKNIFMYSQFFTKSVDLLTRYKNTFCQFPKKKILFFHVAIFFLCFWQKMYQKKLEKKSSCKCAPLFKFWQKRDRIRDTIFWLCTL